MSPDPTTQTATSPVQATTNGSNGLADPCILFCDHSNKPPRTSWLKAAQIHHLQQISNLMPGAALWPHACKTACPWVRG